MGFDPGTIALVSALINAGGAIGGGVLSRDREQKLTGTQKRQNETIDLILQAVKGEGPLAGLVQGDDAAFQRSIVDPLQQQFRDVTTPNIQQGFISNRLQRGTGLEDALSRAGVDLQSNIDQKFLQFQQGGQDRLQQLLGNVLGFSPSVPKQGLSALEGGLAGLAGGASQFDLEGILKLIGSGSGKGINSASPTTPTTLGANQTTRTGFTGGAT